MKKSIIEMILGFIRQIKRNRRWRNTVTCIAALVVFVTTYLMILPAITLEGAHPRLSAETVTGWAGDPMSVTVKAESPAGSGEKVVVITAEAVDAGLSEEYVFDSDEVTVIRDSMDQEILLHRTVREGEEGKEDRFEYWFALSAGQQTEFTLNLQDEIDVKEIMTSAGIVKNVRIDKDAEKASASDADKEETIAAAENEATASDAVKETEAAEATASSASKATPGSAEEDVDDDGKLADGMIVNDLETPDEDAGTEVTATLKLMVGMGNDFEEAVRDVERNAEKRGDASLEYRWRIALNIEKELSWEADGVSVTMFYNNDARIPEDARLFVAEIPQGSAEYNAYLESAKSAMGVDAATASNAASGMDEAQKLDVNYARFFDIRILDADGDEIEPEAQVIVKIDYDEAESITGDTDVQMVHFPKAGGTELVDAIIDGEDKELNGVAFNAGGFSVYGIVGTKKLSATYLTASGETYLIFVNYGPEAGIPEDAELYVEELKGDEQATVESAIDAIRSEETRVAVSRTFDIKILDADGNEIQPAENATVEVSFELAETQNRNLDTNIYHMKADGEEVKPQQMEVETKDGVATVATDGFSYYTVEFTYNNLTYVLNGDSTVPLSEIMDYVGLSGEVTGVEVSDETLFMASEETGEWQVSALQPFSTDEWMKVTVDNIDFEITFLFKVTDAVELPPIYSGGTMNGVKQYGEPNTFLHMCEVPTIIILPDRVNEPDSVTVSDSRFRQEENKISYHGTLDYYSVNAFSNGQMGICTLLYKNAALLQDGSFADVQIKVTEARYFTKEKNSIGRVRQVTPATYPSTEYYLLQWDPINGTRVLSGSSVTEFNNLRVGLEASLEISIVRNGSKVEGSFYYGMTDIDVSRVAVGSMAGIYESAKYIQFSEQVEIVSGAASVAYIPVSGGNSKLYDGLYCCGISNNTGSDANGLLFTPGNEQGDPDPGTFCSGFALLANANGLNIKVRSAGGQTFTVNTTVSPPPIGSLYLRKNVIKGTKLDYQRNWNIKAEIGGSSFEDDQMKHGETVYVGAFMQGLPFTAKEIMPHDWVDYDISWKVLNGVTGKEVSTGESASASGTILPRTIVEFENERLWVENLLTIKKVVLNPGEGDQQKDWWFTVTLTDGSGDDVLPISGLRKPDSAQNWTEVGNGKYKFTLKDGEMIQITLPKGCNYAVEEDEYTEYYTVYDHQRGSLPTETVATVKNMPKPDITVLKVDKNNQPLAEARFKLFRKNESGSYVQVVPSTGSGTDFDVPKEGYVIEKLDSGEYKLIETLAPKGYIILSSDFEFTLNVDSETGFYTITPVSQREDVVIDNTRLIITVSNTPGVALPNTGGPGTLLYTLSGIALMLGAALMYGFRMRLRERRLN